MIKKIHDSFGLKNDFNWIWIEFKFKHDISIEDCPFIGISSILYSINHYQYSKATFVLVYSAICIKQHYLSQLSKMKLE